MTKIHPKLEALIEKELFPHESVFWRGQPGGGFLTTKGWVFFILMNAPFAVMALHSIVLAVRGEMDKEFLKGLAGIFGLMMALTAFLKLVDYQVRRRTAYVITDRRVIMGAKDQDNDWFVSTLTINASTKVWYAKRWDAIHIRTPFCNDRWWGRLGNKMRVGGITMNDVDDPEMVVAMIQTMIDHANPTTN